VDVAVPRDRAGTFTPVLLPKHETRLGGFSDIIISLYAGGMTVRDTRAPPGGAGVSRRPRL
jgi:putative transposase